MANALAPLGPDMTTSFMIFLLFIISYLYWPLLYVRLRDFLSGPYDLTKKKFSLSLLFPFVIILIILFAGYFSIFTQFMINLFGALLLIAVLISAAPIILLLVVSKIKSRNSKLALIVTAIILHLVTSLLGILLEIIFILAIIFIIKFQSRNKTGKNYF